MVNASPSSWTVRGATFAVWLLAAGSCVYWGMKLTAKPAALAPAAAAARAPAPADPAALARLLGGTGAPNAATPAVPVPSRFTLVGVVAGKKASEGAAVIAVDGKPARPFRVGREVVDSLVLQSVEGRRAVLAPATGGAPAVTLELPPPKK